MKHAIILAATALVLGVSAPVAAQTVSPKAPFGCDARAPNSCVFRIYYARGSREVFLAAGMKAMIPDVRIGTDTYCVTINKKPLPTCNRKLITAKYNS